MTIPRILTGWPGTWNRGNGAPDSLPAPLGSCLAGSVDWMMPNETRSKRVRPSQADRQTDRQAKGPKQKGKKKKKTKKRKNTKTIAGSRRITDHGSRRHDVCLAADQINGSLDSMMDQLCATQLVPTFPHHTTHRMHACMRAASLSRWADVLTCLTRLDRTTRSLTLFSTWVGLDPTACCIRLRPFSLASFLSFPLLTILGLELLC